MFVVVAYLLDVQDIVVPYVQPSTETRWFSTDIGDMRSIPNWIILSTPLDAPGISVGGHGKR